MAVDRKEIAMPETKTEARVFTVDMVCDECGRGRMRPTGELQSSYPPWHVHQCDHCHLVKHFLKCYPHTVVEPKE